MDDTTRNEIEKVHARMDDIRERVVMLEAQQPHITAALVRIEGKSDGITASINKFLWTIVIMVGGSLFALLFKAFASGALAHFI